MPRHTTEYHFYRKYVFCSIGSHVFHQNTFAHWMIRGKLLSLVVFSSSASPSFIRDGILVHMEQLVFHDEHSFHFCSCQLRSLYGYSTLYIKMHILSNLSTNRNQHREIQKTLRPFSIYELWRERMNESIWKEIQDKKCPIIRRMANVEPLSGE